METKQADRIANALEEMVFEGQFQEGERLDETRLAQQFAVSRTPIREALQRLVTSGLAQQIPRRGVFVRQPNSTALTEMFEAMAEIEVVCGRLAAQRMTSDGLAALRAANADCIAAVEADDANAYSLANENFHCAIYRLSGNSFLEAEALRLYRRLKPYRRVQFQMRGRMMESLAEHETLIASFVENKVACVEKILRAHVGPQGDRFYPHMAQLKQNPDLRIAS
ncbi:MAG: GntR family transcriptional regulator [Pseudomonadota bacterium]